MDLPIWIHASIVILSLWALSRLKNEERKDSPVMYWGSLCIALAGFIVASYNIVFA